MQIIGKEADESTHHLARPDWRVSFSAIGAWLDERTGFSGPLRSFLFYPVPKYVHNNLLYSLGGLSLISFLLQIATGLLLSFYYDPSPEGAYNSVDYVTYQTPLGWLIRGLHYYNASAIIILVALHTLRTFSFSAYKKPREITWLSGILLLLITLAFAFTGYLLPWDQKGYWATKVGIEIAGSAPLFGEWIARLLRGGLDLGQTTLTRFYVTHMALLPGALVLLIGLHIHQLRYHGMAPPITKRGQALVGKFVPFFPHWVVVDAMLGLILLALLIYLSWNWRAPLEFPADPTSTDFIPRPEWYFLFLFQMLKYFPGPLEPIAAVLIPLIVVGSMLLLPFVDRSEERRPWRKPITTTVALFYVVMIVILTLLALKADQETTVVAAVESSLVVETEVQAEPEAEVEPEVEAEPEPEMEATVMAEVESDSGVEPAVQAEPEIAAENVSKAESKAVAEVEVETEDKTELEDESAEVEPELAPVEEQTATPAISPATSAPLSDQPNTLFAIPVGEARLDSHAEFWAEAPRLEVATIGAKDALNNSDLTQGTVVTVQAAYDSNNLVVRAEWTDSTESILKSAWHWDGSRFVKLGNEDRFILLWPIDNNAEFANKGCAAACHQADEDEDWWMGADSDDIRYDAWQWLSARTNPIGQVDDEWWSTLADPNNPDSSRHTDTKDSGGYQENVAADKRGPAFMQSTDLANPFIFAGQEAPVDPATLNSGDVIPGYLLAPSVGSRGDVSAQGRWADGRWVVVLQRALDTGHDDDVVFIPGKRLPFGLAVMDNKNGIDHTVAPEVLILDWQ